MTQVGFGGGSSHPSQVRYSDDPVLLLGCGEAREEHGQDGRGEEAPNYMLLGAQVPEALLQPVARSSTECLLVNALNRLGRGR